MMAHLTLGEIPWLVIGSLVFGVAIVGDLVRRYLDR
jgi:hypothetical protein